VYPASVSAKSTDGTHVRNLLDRQEDVINTHFLDKSAGPHEKGDNPTWRSSDLAVEAILRPIAPGGIAPHPFHKGLAVCA
jgi:hypothetical protein